MKAQNACYLCGPTAVGKSAVALELAAQLNGEIISVDSMQVYRGMDIGTAKPSPAERRRVCHHLIDVADFDESFDAAKFVSLAKAAENEIRSRGKQPIYCGGTGLYFNALLHGLGDAPASDPELRAALEAIPLTELVAELQRINPEAAEDVDLRNPRRVIRALEVIRMTGKPVSEQRASWKRSTETVVGLDMERSSLVRRIDERVEGMFQRGLVEETKALISRGLRENRTACQALGYKQVIDHVDGELSLPETINLVKLRTRQFAKRQLTWFRRQLNCEWVQVSETDSAGSIAAKVAHRFG